jgi:tetratricopeptide (TPR) repeat protein
MSKSYIAASAAAFALAFGVLPLQASEAQQPSKANVKTLAAANEAYRAKRCPEAISKSKEALAVSDKSAYDTYLANTFMAGCYQQQGNKAEMMKAFQGQLDSGHPSPAEQNTIIKNMYGTAFELKDYAQAAELGQRMIRSGTAQPETYDQVALAMIQQGKNADASKFLSEYVADLEKRGQKPREATLTQLRALQEKLGDANGAAATLEKLVVNYPKPDYWNLVTYSLARDPKLNDRQKMHIYRLRVATGTLKLCRDFTEMADFAVNSNLAGEGQKVIDQGLAAKVCKEKVEQDRLERLRNAAAKIAAEERAKLPKLEADAKAARTGEPDVALGSSQFGFGEYAKSAEWLARGVGKGGLKDVADAQMTLGIAYLRAGNKAEALKTFNSIKTADPNMQRIVKLWKLYAQ